MDPDPWHVVPSFMALPVAVRARVPSLFGHPAMVVATLTLATAMVTPTPFSRSPSQVPHRRGKQNVADNRCSLFNNNIPMQLQALVPGRVLLNAGNHL